MFNRWNLVILACVVIMTTGQILFKQVALNYNRIGTIADWGVLGILLLAAAMYAASTGLWVWALRTVELSKAYPYFALGFVLVPLFGAWMFNEILTGRYAIGVALIVAGVILTSS